MKKLNFTLMDIVKKNFDYNGFEMEFEVIDGEVFANATLMCRAFGKRPTKWLELESAKRYIDAVKAKSEKRTLVSEKRTLVETRQGGLSAGTWIHERLILKLAQWLDVDFEIWCDEKVTELLRDGVTFLEANTNKPISRERRIAEAFLLSQEIIAEKDEVIKQLTPRAEYTDKVLTSKTCYTATEIAKELGMSAQTLNAVLRDAEIQYKLANRGHYVLYAKYQNLGYTATETHTYEDYEGNTRTSMQMVWTERGRAFIHAKLNGDISFGTKLSSVPRKQILA